MSRLLAAAVLLVLILVATTTSFAASEDSKLDGDTDVFSANANETEFSGNKTKPKEDTFADMIDRALEKEFTENEDQNEGFLDLKFLCRFYLARFIFIVLICLQLIRVGIGLYLLTLRN